MSAITDQIEEPPICSSVTCYSCGPKAGPTCGLEYWQRTLSDFPQQKWSRTAPQDAGHSENAGVEMTSILLITFNPAIFATCARPAASCFQPVNLGSNLLLIDLSGSGWEQISWGVRSAKEFHLWQERRYEKNTKCYSWKKKSFQHF